MQWEDLVTFRAVATDLSFTRAARRLHISKPVVSARVKRLERNLGVQLLCRDTRNVTLTDVGRRFLTRVNSVTDSLERACREITRPDSPGERPTVRLCLVGTTTPALPMLLGQVDQSFDMAVRWTPDSAGAWADLRSGAADVVVHSRWEPGDGARAAADPMLCELLISTSLAEVGVGARHRLVGRGTVALRDLTGENWIMPPTSHERESAAAAVAAVAGYTPRFTMRPTSNDEAIALQRFGDAVALTTESEHAPAGTVKHPIDDDLHLRTYLTWHHRSSAAARCGALADLLLAKASA